MSDVFKNEHIANLRKQLDSSNAVREDIIDLLNNGIKGFNPNIAEMSPEDREAFSSVINSLTKMLHGKDTANIGFMRILQNEESNENASNMAELVGEFLTKLTIRDRGATNHEPVNLDDAQKKIEEVVEKHDIEIKEEELEIAGE